MKKAIVLIAIVLLASMIMPAGAQAYAANGKNVPQAPGGQSSGGDGSTLGCPGCPGCPDNPKRVPGEPGCY